MSKIVYEVSPARIRKKGDELVSTGDKELDEAYTAIVSLISSGNTSANKVRLFMVGDFDALKKDEEPLDFSGATPGIDR